MREVKPWCSSAEAYLILIRIWSAHVKHTSVSCSRWPIRDRDSPRSCRWAAASMGSTSGTLAGDSVTAAGALLGDTTPVAIVEAVTITRGDISEKIKEIPTLRLKMQVLEVSFMVPNLCSWSQWRSCVWQWWPQPCSACAADIALSAATPVKDTHKYLSSVTHLTDIKVQNVMREFEHSFEFYYFNKL